MSASVLNYAADQRLLHMLGGDLLGSSQKENKGDCASCLAPPLAGLAKFGAGDTSQPNIFTTEQLHSNSRKMRLFIEILHS